MPSIANPHCKYEGCTAPRHVYPGGYPSQYCAEHMYHRKAKSRPGHASMTGQMLDVLKHLRAMKRRGEIWVELGYPLAHGITLSGLIERDWIFESDGLDGRTLYKITSRGEEALLVYEPAINRRDGICPACCERPKHIRSSGKKDAYCIECQREKGKRKRAMGKANGDVNRPCSRCHKRPRHQYAGGSYSSYCLHCERVRTRRRMKRERRALFKAVQGGAPVPLCKKCKAAPRVVFANTVASFCAQCQRESVKKARLNAVLRRKMQP